MKLFFESYHYDKSLLKTYFSSHFYHVVEHGSKGALGYVGYYYHYDNENSDLSDSIFVLPKVFLDENNHPFGLKDLFPQDIIDLNHAKETIFKDKDILEMIFSLSTWIYQAISEFDERNQDSKILENELIQNVVSNKGEDSSTFLDIILQLLAFNKQHKNLFTYISIINSSGQNKIHWGKTISSIQPVLKNHKPVYLNFKNKSKTVNYDEDIIVLFYSVLNYLRGHYNFKYYIVPGYSPFPMSKIDMMIKTCKGTRYLKSIRKKYFMDELVALWKLLYAFFDKAEKVATKRYHEDTLLVRNFNSVFEDMIDYLISDDIDKYPKELKYQSDGKIIDHIYRDESLLYNNDIYYVGDSKYYKLGSDLTKESVEKQYTYAKNIIQRNINVIYNFVSVPSKDGYLQYRDPLTEGYNVTPNFFISGNVIHGHYNYTDSELRPSNDGEQTMINRHFVNRLFDRDTLILQRYDINFLYVLSAYVTQQNSVRDTFKKAARNKFKLGLQKVLNDNYRFFQICLPKFLKIKDFVDNNFKSLVGKVFSFNDILIYALERESLESQAIPANGNKFLELNGSKYQLEEYKIGQDIQKEYENLAAEVEEEPVLWEIVSSVNDVSKFTIYLPLFSVKAVCGIEGTYRELPIDEAIGWIDVSSVLPKLNNKMFIVQALGDSMEPKISDGDFLVFSLYESGSRNGEIVLTQRGNKDGDYMCNYTIKEYHSTKTYSGEIWEHESIQLKSLNPKYDPIVITVENGEEYKTIGILKYNLSKQ